MAADRHAHPPRVVVEGTLAMVDAAERELAERGWAVAGPGTVAPSRRPVVRRLTLAEGTDTAGILLVTVGGDGVLVHAIASRPVIDGLVDDLRRLGPVDHRVDVPPGPPDIDPVARAILGLLAEGHSLGEAARILGVSRRTADRRLASGRQAMGATRTTQAIALARRSGWLGREDPTGR